MQLPPAPPGAGGTPTYPGAPGPAGYPVDPVAVAFGTVAQIPLPTEAPLVGSQPTPPAFQWVVILNSSPNTLIIRQGQVLGTVAAFTGDKFRLTDGTGRSPLTLEPQALAVPAAPGSDSQVYATWYESDPGGAFPSSLGAGAARLINASSSVFPLALVPIPAASGVIVPSSPVPTYGFGSVHITADEISLAAVPRVDTVTITWYDANQVAIASRDFVIGLGETTATGPRCRLEVTVPHLGDFFDVRLQNNSANAHNVSLSIEQITAVETVFSIPAQDQFGPPALPDSILDSQGGIVVAIGATTTLAESHRAFGGRVAFFAICSSTAGLGTLFQVQAIDGNGLWHTIFQQPAASVTGTVWELIVPPAPLRLRVVNNTGVANTCSCIAIPDSYHNA